MGYLLVVSFGIMLVEIIVRKKPTDEMFATDFETMDKCFASRQCFRSSGCWPIEHRR
ncbi:hypothetical protein RchiOBHm_Chr4g0404381 [Rosa chinensis]|uniref:Uncharacterized protein n=1 Tax=Rosa chinensis TaxID=74649 RepID=A0A2P6QTT7_ROSCH|nr:hypothetical protein RchiOBHm_Chr4g0404381 [Rosa chinensis]